MNENLINHIARFAMMDHWVDEMRRWTLELQKEHPSEFGGLGAAVADRLKLLREQNNGGKSHERS